MHEMHWPMPISASHAHLRPLVFAARNATDLLGANDVTLAQVIAYWASLL
jgi:hypothetical protein